MNTDKAIKGFEKNLYFFDWLLSHEDFCSVCGVRCMLSTVFFDNYISVRLCGYCDRDLEIVQ
jgi:hypothetical protein